MPKKKLNPLHPVVMMPCTISFLTLIDDQEISAQALLDLAAIATPATRPEWSSMLHAAARVQRRLQIADWLDLGLQLGDLVTSLGLQLDAREARELLQEAIERTRRDGAQLGFCAIAHRLCVIATI
jgi:hypothetical protein